MCKLKPTESDEYLATLKTKNRAPAKKGYYAQKVRKNGHCPKKAFMLVKSNTKWKKRNIDRLKKERRYTSLFVLRSIIYISHPFPHTLTHPLID